MPRYRPFRPIRGAFYVRAAAIGKANSRTHAPLSSFQADTRAFLCVRAAIRKKSNLRHICRPSSFRQMGQRLLLPFPLWGKGQGERGQWILPTVTGMACRCPCTMYKVTGMACRCPCTMYKVTGMACRCPCTMYKVTGMACRCPCTLSACLLW